MARRYFPGQNPVGKQITLGISYNEQLSPADTNGVTGEIVGIVGDVKHSRVARSNVLALTALGARVTLVAPPTLLPPSLDGWDVDVSGDLDDVVPKLDVCYLLRMQLERQEQALVPSLREYSAGYGLTPERAARLPAHALVMHPGPMNRGVEIAPEVAALPRSVVTKQVTNGVAVRMAVLFQLLGASGPAGAGGAGSPGIDGGAA